MADLLEAEVFMCPVDPEHHPPMKHVKTTWGAAERCVETWKCPTCHREVLEEVFTPLTAPKNKPAVGFMCSHCHVAEALPNEFLCDSCTRTLAFIEGGGWLAGEAN